MKKIDNQKGLYIFIFLIFFSISLLQSIDMLAFAQKTDVHALYSLAGKYVREKNYNEAIATYQQLVNDYPAHPLAPKALYTIGEIYFFQKNYDMMELTFQEVTARYPKTPEARAAELGLCGNRLQAEKKYRELIISLRMFIEKHSSEPEYNDVKSLAQQVIGSSYMLLGEKKQAIQELQKVWEEYPETFPAKGALLSASELYRELGEEEKMIELLHKFVQMYPKEAYKAYLRLGTYYEKKEKYRDALEAYKKAAETEPKPKSCLPKGAVRSASEAGIRRIEQKLGIKKSEGHSSVFNHCICESTTNQPLPKESGCSCGCNKSSCIK